MKDLVNLKPFREYAELKSQLVELEAKIKKLSDVLFPNLLDLPNNNLETEFGIFKVVYVPTWKYSDELTEKESVLKEKLKLLKKKEQIEKVAQIVNGGGRVVFSAKKQEE